MQQQPAISENCYIPAAPMEELSAPAQIGASVLLRGINDENVAASTSGARRRTSASKRRRRKWLRRK